MWKRETGGYWARHEAKPWNEIELPAGLAGLRFRLFHWCRRDSIGVQGYEVTERCRCGAVRRGQTPINQVMWQPETRQLTYTIETGWTERNARLNGIAMFYLPTPHALNTD